MALAGKRNQGANDGEGFCNHPVGGIEIFGAKVFPILI
jgi:hypothetical protein